MKKFGVSLAIVCSSLGLAQSPEVDKALKERAATFYDLHVQGKFRQAEQYVADESKDDFYNSEKPRYLKCQQGKVAYADNFTKAVVSTLCNREVTTQFGKMKLDVGVDSNWRLENGKWMLYIVKGEVASPFGKFKLDPVPPGTDPKMPDVSKIHIQDILRGVTLSKRKVDFPAKGGTDEVVIHNGMPGKITLKLRPLATPMPGLSFKLDADKLDVNQDAHLTFSFEHQQEAPLPVTLQLEVQPINQVVPIQIVVGPEQAR